MRVIDSISKKLLGSQQSAPAGSAGKPLSDVVN
jgi:hypothetical protein